MSVLKIKDSQGNWQSVSAIKGDKGDTGSQGPQGIQGIQGPAGQNGTNGTNGQDGFSPSASVSKSGSVATISITDKVGTTTATISDGQTPDMSNYYTKTETDQAIANAITTTLGGSF